MNLENIYQSLNYINFNSFCLYIAVFITIQIKQSTLLRLCIAQIMYYDFRMKTEREKKNSTKCKLTFQLIKKSQNEKQEKKFDEICFVWRQGKPSYTIEWCIIEMFFVLYIQ